MLAACSSVVPIPSPRTAYALSTRRKRSTKCVGEMILAGAANLLSGSSPVTLSLLYNVCMMSDGV